MAKLEQNAQALMEAVWQLPTGSRTKDAKGVEMTEEEMYNNISSKIQACVDKAEGILKEGEPQIQMAEKILHIWAKPEAAEDKQVQDKAETRKDPEFWQTKRFHPQQNLRPTKLEKESSME